MSNYWNFIYVNSLHSCITFDTKQSEKLIHQANQCEIVFKSIIFDTLLYIQKKNGTRKSKNQRESYYIVLLLFPNRHTNFNSNSYVTITIEKACKSVLMARTVCRLCITPFPRNNARARNFHRQTNYTGGSQWQKYPRRRPGINIHVCPNDNTLYHMLDTHVLRPLVIPRVLPVIPIHSLSPFRPFILSVAPNPGRIIERWNTRLLH